jgi:SAM-dependent methyltransferase
MLEAMNRAARFFDADYTDYDEDIPVLAAFAQRTGGPLLDLGCGTGRALLPLAKRGYHVTGVDISPQMLRIAAAKARAARVVRRVTLVEGNYTDAPLAGPYAFAFVLMNTFMHLVSQEEQLQALRHWREHLAPEGLLLIDVFHPDVGVLANLDGKLQYDKTWTDAETGRTVMKWATSIAELAEQTLHVQLIYEEIGPDGAVHRTIVPYNIRYLWRYEAELLLDKAGFDLETIYGDWDLSPFGSDSDRMILIARRRE